MVSQKDIARRLNMTQQAVSAALRDAANSKGTSKVSPETRELVIKTAKEMGYFSNRYAAVLKSGRSRLFAVIHGAVTPDWFEKLRVLCEAIEECGYIPWTLDYSHYKGGAEQAIEQALSSKVEGLIFAVMPQQTDLTAVKKAKVPVVAYGSMPLPGIPLVNPHKEEAFGWIIQHLYEQGCRKMTVCWSMPKDQVDIHSRATAAAASRALQHFSEKHRLKYRHPITVLPDALSVRDEYYMGYCLAQEALKRRDRPDALIFPNDTLAIGGMRACAEARVRIPKDICVTGFNNERQSAYAMSPLTTVAQPIEIMARKTVEILRRQVEGREKPSEREHLFPCSLVIRHSSLFGKEPC